MVAYTELVESRLGDPGLAEWGERCECRLRFSIVIPAYNEEAFIGGTLRSLLAQDFADPYEVIVVDNNSSDETARVAMAHGAVVVREERQGVCWARQRGTEIAAGEIIVSADADTVYGTGWLSRIDPEFRKDSGCVAVVGPFRFADAPWWGEAWTAFLFGFVFIVSRLTRRVPYVAAANLAFRKKDWLGYSTYATQGGDELDLLRRLQARGRVAFIPDNPVLTSSRRLSRGFIYNAVVTVFYYYFLGYTLNRLTRRPVIGMAPAFRAPAAQRKPRRWLQAASTPTGEPLYRDHAAQWVGELARLQLAIKDSPPYWAAVHADLVFNAPQLRAYRQELSAIDEETAVLFAQLTNLRLQDIVAWHIAPRG